MAVQIRLMGNDDEVAAVMAALEAGAPVTVMWDGSLTPNRRDGGARAFGMAALGGAVAEQQVRQARADRLDRERPTLGRGSAAVSRRRSGGVR